MKSENPLTDRLANLQRQADPDPLGGCIAVFLLRITILIALIVILGLIIWVPIPSPLWAIITAKSLGSAAVTTIAIMLWHRCER